jgi:hypothetical protein
MATNNLELISSKVLKIFKVSTPRVAHRTLQCILTVGNLNSHHTPATFRLTNLPLPLNALLLYIERGKPSPMAVLMNSERDTLEMYFYSSAREHIKKTVFISTPYTTQAGYGSTRMKMNTCHDHRACRPRNVN